ncbi:hypothetical protein GZ77_26370 [Endozoicomonas montiporae]|uniref:Uncharacterized protein n=1 Tax=Endozoicomonas montiporae TaxID=1027273 RepID=A0A081MYK3_9GAMM|nr:hypothetical protein [Endozoicomonas montiporae]KEQ11276.1 hypothetical protein GZ77_26370 [Endozoicomonas montiporae]
MKVALTSPTTGEVHTLGATIHNRVGFSLKGHLYLTVETRPDFTISWEYWNECQGVLVASNPEERKRFERWEQCGRDYEGQWWKKEKQA